MNNQKVPDKNTLARWQDEGLTHQQMADRVQLETGERVSRAAISMALKRYGLTDETQPRYPVEVPWTVFERHQRAYPVRMLRLLGRRRAGREMSEEQEARLNAWLRWIKETDSVVGYDPDTDQGFWYVPREEGDPIGTPVRVRTIHTGR